MRQVASYGGNFDPDSDGKFTKYYSEDGSYEIIKNNQTGQEKHLIYIGGTPYEANIVYLKNYTESSGSYKFLHKDYLGSILAITDEAGNKLEQRHFDAWGNLTHLKIGTNATITDKNQIRDYLANGNLVIDRGYTIHEHFAEIGIIHMNGRLYDPLLRRFLNADENIQDPNNTQNYNKYGYVLNNPLIYSDPSGELFWLAILAGAIIGAVTGGAHYIGVALQTGKFNIGGFFKAIIGGAVTGAILGAIAPMAVPTGTLGGFALAGFVGSFMPSMSINLGGGLSFSLSLSIAFGNTLSLGANFAFSYNKGDWNISAGFGISKNVNTGNIGLSFWEKRYSGSIGYDDGKFGFSLYSTTFRGGGLNQRVGGLMLRQGDFSFRYENDGMPFSIKKGFPWLGDGNDSWRTASARLSYKEFGIGFNLFTGYRDNYEGDNEKIGNGCYGDFGEYYPNNLVREDLTVSPPYRMGALYMSVGNMRMGQDSEYFRHAIQNRWAHDMKFPLNTQQPGFPMLSNGYNNYIQFQTANPFTLW